MINHLPAIKIEILVAPPTSGTRDAWDELVMVKGCDTDFQKLADKKNCTKYREDGAVIEAGENDTLIVQKLGIFFQMLLVILDTVTLLQTKIKLRLQKLMELLQQLKEYRNITYPVARPLFLYAKKAHASVIPGFKEFLT